MAYKTKAQREARNLEAKQIRDTIRELKTNESMDIITSFTSREMPSIVGFIKDAAGYYKDFRCSKIPDGLRITCESTYKITAVHEVDVTLYTSN
jgi:hypothetical protein